jgi:DNA-directed RNA polymerase subunit K/omega
LKDDDGTTTDTGAMKMRIITPHEVAKQAGNKYLGVLVAAKFARYLNEFPKDQLQQPSEKLTTKAMQELVDGDLNYKLLRRRRSEA